MTFRQIANYFSIDAASLEHGIHVYLWRESENGLPCHQFDSLDAAVAVYGDENLDNSGWAVHIHNEFVTFWLQ